MLVSEQATRLSVGCEMVQPLWNCLLLPIEQHVLPETQSPQHFPMKNRRNMSTEICIEMLLFTFFFFF